MLAPDGDNAETLSYASIRFGRKHAPKILTRASAVIVLYLCVCVGFVVAIPRFSCGGGAVMRATQALIGAHGPIATALELYHQQLGKYPRRLVDLIERPESIASDDDRWFQFIQESEFRDPRGNPLQYTPTLNGYVLTSLGPDGKPGGGDDIVNK